MLCDDSGEDDNDKEDKEEDDHKVNTESQPSITEKVSSFKTTSEPLLPADKEYQETTNIFSSNGKVDHETE